MSCFHVLKSERSYLARVSAALCLAPVLGCGTNSANSGGNTPEVRVISDDLVADDDGRILLPPGYEELQPGSGLITGNGTHLYLVEDVDLMPDGSVQIATSQGNLGQLGIAGKFQFADPTPDTVLKKRGVRLAGPDLNLQILDISMPFSTTLNITDDGNVTAAVDGIFELDGLFHLAFDIGLFEGLKTFSSYVGGDAFLDFDASVVARSGVNISREQTEQAVTEQFRSYYQGVIGAPPYYVLVEVTSQLFIGFEGEVEAGASLDTGVLASADAKVGAEYDSARDAGTQWSVIAESGFDWGYDEPAICFDGSGSLRAYLRPHFEVQLYSVVGPTFDIEPYGQLDATIEGCLGDSATQYDISLTAGAVGYAKVKADILDLFVLESPRMTVFDISRELQRWQNTPPPGCTSNDECPNDGQFCNGTESCNTTTGQCVSSSVPCEDGETCDEETDSCLPPVVCIDDLECNDGVYCNGVEACDMNTGQCVQGIPPCDQDAVCDEDGSRCDETSESLEIANIPDATISVGSAYTGPLPTLLTGAGQITWSLSYGPPGMTINAMTGVVTWASPTQGEHTITIRATNNAGSDDESWRLLTTEAFAPDLVIDRIVFNGDGGPVTVRHGQMATLDARISYTWQVYVRNQGNEPAGASVALVAWNDGAGNCTVLPYDYFMGAVSIGDLSPGAEDSGGGNWLWGEDYVGTYSLVARADRDNDVVEGNEPNNDFCATVTVADEPDDARAMYHFDEGTGTFVTDSSGNGFHGTQARSTDWGNSDEAYAGASCFENVDESDSGYMSIPPAVLDDSTAGAVDFWAMLYSQGTITGDELTILTHADGINADDLTIDCSIELGFRGLFRHADGGGAFTDVTTGPVDINTWYHVRVEWTGTEYQIYLDGALMDSAPQVRDLESKAFCHVGRGAFGNVNRAWHGRIDEFRIESTAGEPPHEDHYDGTFNTTFGWHSMGGYSLINTADGWLEFEGRDSVDAYVYADLEGDAASGDFELQFRTYVDSYAPNPNAIIAGYADSIGKYREWQNGIYVTVDQNLAPTHGKRFGLGQRKNGVGDDSTRIWTFEWSEDRWYYLTLTRSGSTATLSVYDDAARTQLLGSVSINGAPTGSFRYLYAFSGAWACCANEVIYGRVDDFFEASVP